MMMLLKLTMALNGLLLGSNTVPTKSSILSSLVVVAVAMVLVAEGAGQEGIAHLLLDNLQAVEALLSLH
jgi:hypothetical protein